MVKRLLHLREHVQYLAAVSPELLLTETEWKQQETLGHDPQDTIRGNGQAPVGLDHPWQLPQGVVVLEGGVAQAAPSGFTNRRFNGAARDQALRQ